MQKTIEDLQMKPAAQERGMGLTALRTSPLSPVLLHAPIQKKIQYPAITLVGVRLAPKQRLANIRQLVGETDREYLDRFDHILFEGEMVDEDAKIIGVVGGLTMGSKIWKDMNRHWTKTYAEFRECAGVIMSIMETLALEMGAKEEKKVTTAESKKWSSKKVGGSEYKAPDNIKASATVKAEARAAECKELKENLDRVLSVKIDTVYNNIKDRSWLSQPRKIFADESKFNKRRFCSYYGNIGHFTSECRDLLRQLWKFYEDGRLTEFVNKQPAKRP
ncbi:hypothetical protein ACS0TY_007633 [Phlomoides rotata]